MTISASIGIALSGADVADVEDLLRRGDLAMYDAKRNGKRRLALYTPAMLKMLEADFARLPGLLGALEAAPLEALPEPEPEPAVEAPAEQLGLF